MVERHINKVLSENLERHMLKKQWDKNKLSKESGVAPRTIGYYLKPDQRQAGSKGKAPSAKLSEVQMLAQALELETWELLRDLTPEQWSAYERIEAAFFDLHPKEAAPAPSNTSSERKAA